MHAACGCGMSVRSVLRKLCAATGLGTCCCYATTVGRPELIYNRDAPGTEALAGIPSLRETFWPTPWCFNHVAQLVRIELAKRELKACTRAGRPRASFRRQLLPTSDGGVVALDWLLDDGSEDDSGRDGDSDSVGDGRDGKRDRRVCSCPELQGLTPLEASAPVCLFLHTITATVDDQYGMPGFFLEARRRGFRPAVHVRRGHGGLPLQTRRFSTVGEPADVALAVDAARQAHPRARGIVLIGCSAGSNSLMRYLGDHPVEARRAGVIAAVAVCPGFRLPEAWTRTQPPWSSVVLGKMKSFFIERNTSTWQHAGGCSGAGGAGKTADAAGAQAEDVHELADAALRAQSLQEFQKAAAALAGFASYDAYNEAMDPMRVLHKVRAPLLCIAARNDPLCVIDNVTTAEVLAHFRAHAPPAGEAGSAAVLAITRTGSHLSFARGFAGDNWAYSAALEFADAALALNAKKPHEEKDN